MAKKKHAYKKVGKPPGFLVYTGDHPISKVSVDWIEAEEQSFKETEDINLKNFQPTKALNWVNINGIADVDAIAKIGEQFKLHPLTLEDIVNVGSRPKMEEHDDYIFIVLKMLYYREDQLIVEHVSFVLKEDLILSFQELEQDVFESIRLRLTEGKGRIRKSGIDYVLYALIDALVDHYFLVFENFGDKIEDLEDLILKDPDDSIALRIQKLKREVYKIRKAAFPLREVLSRFERTENELVQDITKPFIRDVHDHSIQIIETVENYRDLTMGLMDLYMSGISNKMNNVMKVLTIIATIFIPLTFIAGVYGMNFENIPELHYEYGYFILWGVMVVMFLAMLYYFKRKKWL